LIDLDQSSFIPILADILTQGVIDRRGRLFGRMEGFAQAFSIFGRPWGQEAPKACLGQAPLVIAPLGNQAFQKLHASIIEECGDAYGRWRRRWEGFGGGKQQGLRRRCQGRRV